MRWTVPNKLKETVPSRQRQLAEARENLSLVQERKEEFERSTDIPLQLVKEERRLRARIAELEQQLAAQPVEDGTESTSEQSPSVKYSFLAKIGKRLSNLPKALRTILSR
jgi:BMFP domain-containing protein YqiC